MDVWAVPNSKITTFLLMYSPGSGKLLMNKFDDLRNIRFFKFYKEPVDSLK